ncbi:hypothetical protein ABT173_01530 [Streptomyces sp. NPDC001795]|uniref:hypothetical protein n=1 Tax=Streptomyces sp. NPDC001795 TaxID=3154525 RepID=UPI0033253576
MTPPSLLPAVLVRPELLPPGLIGTPGRRPRRPGDSGFELPDPPQCPHDRLLVVIIFDDSYSVTGGNDPVGNRYREAAAALTHLGRRCRCGRLRVAIVHFDRGTSVDVDPTPLNRRGSRRLAGGLAPPPGRYSGSSKLGPALDRAQEIADAHPDHQVAVCVFSDFELLDPQPEAVLDRLCAWPGPAHAVVLHNPPPGRLRDAPTVTVTGIGWASDRGSVARAVYGALTTHSLHRKA